ncbi:MAG: hypothetical protein JSW28_07005 [Thermoplasmata archaeon]|nr:MAG: hypothetical protein JSW28_07005 [Thermoplasmata archaeon]
MDEPAYERNQLLIILFLIGLFYGFIGIIMEILLHAVLGFGICLIEFMGYALVIVTAHLVYKDAQKINAGNASERQRLLEPLTWSPTSWGLLVLLFWIIMMPLYLFLRREIYWKNLPRPTYTLKPRTHIPRQTFPKQQVIEPPQYGENVRICPNCETPYSIKMLERTRECKRCGEPLK